MRIKLVSIDGIAKTCFIYLNSKLFLDWNTKYNNVSGTYFNKQQLYKVNNFTD